MPQVMTVKSIPKRTIPIQETNRININDRKYFVFIKKQNINGLTKKRMADKQVSKLQPLK